MLFEMRTYEVLPGKAPEFMKFYEAEAIPIITKYLPLAGCWLTESGTLNSVVFLWRYESYEDRIKRRAALNEDPAWPPIFPRILPYLVHQQSVFLRDALSIPLPAGRD